MSLPSKNKLTRRLQSALQEKKLVETSTAAVIRRLQEKGCWVFAVTSRYAEMANLTHRVLTELGVDFSLHAPFPKGCVLLFAVSLRLTHSRFRVLQERAA